MLTQTASAILKALQAYEADVTEFTNARCSKEITWSYSKPSITSFTTFLQISQSRYPLKDNWRYGTEQWLTIRLTPTARVKRFLAQQRYIASVEELRELLVVAARYEKLKALSNK